MAVRVFISYAREDEVFRKALEQGLKQLQRQGLIEIWHDRKIRAGEEWEGRISGELEAADVVVLLVSRDFIDSDYCTDVEVTRALSRHERGEAVVVPVILRHCTWDWAPFASLQVLPKDGRPVKGWPDQDEAWTEIARGLRAVIERVAAQKGSLSAPGNIRPAVALPPLGHCFGRDAVVSDLAEALLCEPAARIPILGQAGIGKTTVSLAALHRPAVADRFGARRCFVRLDAVRDAEAAAAAIATALRIEPGPDLRGRMLKELAHGPVALVLDNLETPWDADTAGTEELLAELSALPSVALLASIRGAAQPGRVAWNREVHVRPVDEVEAANVFCTIAGEELRDAPQLRPLLARLAGVPLAIVLLAHAARGNDLGNLAEEWEEQRTALLRRGGGAADRERSWAASLELSLRSPRMTGEGLRLASLLGVLPDGVAQRDLRALLGGAGPGAARVLAQLELAYFDGGRLLMLPPVREHLAAARPPAAEDLARAMAFYRELAEKLGLKAGRAGGAAAIARLAPEVANLDAVIRMGLEGVECARWIDTATSIAEFASMSGHVTPSPLRSALAAATVIGDLRRKAECMRSLGAIALHRSQYEQAREMFENARPLYCQVEDLRGEADCIKRLADIAFRRSQHEQAQLMYEKAQSLCGQVGDMQGEADCMVSLGNIAVRRSQYERARELYEKAQPLYSQVGDVRGEANCIFGLGEIAIACSQYERARAMYTNAQLLYRQVGSVHGEANCHMILGNMAFACFHDDEARAMLEYAMALYRRVGSVRGEANCLYRLGDVAHAYGDLCGARSRYEAALTLFAQIPEPHSMGLTHRRLARLSTDPISRRTHVAAARSAWLSIDRPDLVAALDSEFSTDPPAA